ncbi:MAG: M48 family metallopeptidase [Alphaproteobacteria bacterium]|nr:M48 family metallopeptidase [Alphaproteobacteria bacterium]
MREEVPIHQRFPRIDPTAWEHPGDRAALDALRAVPGFDGLARLTVGKLQDGLHVERLRRKAKPAADHDPRLDRLWIRIQRILDAPEPIPLYVTEDKGINGYTTGLHRPTVFLTDGTTRLPEEQLAVVLAHELGHVLSGHVTWKTLVRMLEAGRWWVLGTGVNLVLTLPVVLALQEWDRKSELSADRASLLVVQDVRPVVDVLERAHAGVELAKLERREKISKVTPLAADAVEALEGWFSRHPPVEERVGELRTWAKGDAFAEILAGRYARRSREAVTAAALDQRVATLAEGLASQARTAEARAKVLSEELTRRCGAAIDWMKKQAGGED